MAKLVWIWAALALAAAGKAQFTTARVSVGTDGNDGFGMAANYSAVSDNGQIVVFRSRATNVVPGDDNGWEDLFRYDRSTGRVVKITRAFNGGSANGASCNQRNLSMSADGRYVAFTSAASNLVPNDTNGRFDLFLYDAQTDSIRRLGMPAGGAEPNGNAQELSISRDGRFLAFSSSSTNLVSDDTNGTVDVFVTEVATDAVVRVSTDSSGLQANGSSLAPDISATGDWIAFRSTATNLAPNDVNGAGWDVFLKSRITGNVRAVTVNPNGRTGDVSSPAIIWTMDEDERMDLASSDVSADGRFVAFYSTARDLVSNDTNNLSDVFLRDMQTQTTVRVSQSQAGVQGNSTSIAVRMTHDARFVFFSSTANNLGPNNNGNLQIYRWTRGTGEVRLASVTSTGIGGNGPSYSPSGVSSDGRYPIFTTDATNFDPSDDNLLRDIYLRDETANVTERVSVGNFRVQVGPGGWNLVPMISGNGRFVTWSTRCPTYVPSDTNGAEDVFVRDLQTNTTERVNLGAGGAQSNGRVVYGPSPLSFDGALVAFTSTATNLDGGSGEANIFIRDRSFGVTSRISRAAGGGAANGGSQWPVMSRNGRYVVFHSDASNLVAGDSNATRDVFVHDRQTGVTELVSVGAGGVLGNGASSAGAVSDDGRFVAFYSAASNLVTGDTNNALDVFLRDRVAGTTVRLSVSGSGVQGNGASQLPTISADGRYIAFSSLASNLVSSDGNGQEDVFVKDVQTGNVTLVARSMFEVLGNGRSYEAAISADGRFVAFSSVSDNLVPNDINASTDQFAKDLATGQIIMISRTTAGDLGTGFTSKVSLADNGLAAAYEAYGVLVPEDDNRALDIYATRFSKGANSAPQIQVIGDRSIVEQAELRVQVFAIDDFGDRRTWSLVDPPAGATIDPVTGVLTWTPTFGQAGVYTVTVRVTDDNDPPASDTETFTVTVNENAAETVLPSSFTVPRGSFVSGVLEDLYADDDRRVVIDQRPPFLVSDPHAALEALGTGTPGTLTGLRLVAVLSSNVVPSSSVQQRVQLFDHEAGQWVTIDTRNPTGADSRVAIAVTDRPGRFLSATGALRARVQWFERGALSPNWSVRIDQIVWQLGR